VRTTLSLDDDVAAQLKTRARRTGRGFKDVVNEALRRGLASVATAPARAPFKVGARDLGRATPGLNLDNVSELLDQIEGPVRR